MEKARQSRIAVTLMDGKLSGTIYGDEQEVGYLICKSAFDLLESNPNMFPAIRKGMRKVFRLRFKNWMRYTVNTVRGWVRSHAYYGYHVLLAVIIFVICLKL